MQKIKKILAVALATTMVVGACVSAFADPVTSGGTNGSGTSEGHVDKELINVVLPTVPDGSTPFAYTMDPERLIQETEAAKYAEGTSFPEAASDTGVYFLTAANTYANASSSLQAINKSSCDVTLTVKVKTTQNTAKDIDLATSSTVATTGTANLYLGLKVGDTTTVVKADEQEVTKTIAGVPSNFEVAVSEGAYVYQEKASATTWKAMNLSMEGAVSNLPIAADTTAPTVNVTWEYAKAADGATVATDAVDYSTTPVVVDAAPSIATTSYTMATGTAVEIPFSLGSGASAATGISSITYKNSSNADRTLEASNYTVADGKITIASTYTDGLISANVTSRVFTVVFDDENNTSVNVTLAVE